MTKTIILAGGYGTRLSEYTESIPKPMVEVGGEPIIKHIINYYSKFDFNNFYIALGYKKEIIKNYFINFDNISQDIKIDMKNNKIQQLSKNKKKWVVNLIDTGLTSMTGGRLKRFKKYLKKNEDFFLTYGDGVADVNLKNLLKFHKKHKKMITVTSVRPPARFGLMEINKKNEVTSFKEKVSFKNGWINGGFFVINERFLDYIDNDYTYLEREPLELMSKMNELMAYPHDGFWHSMDTKRDKDNLEELFQNNQLEWLK